MVFLIQKEMLELVIHSDQVYKLSIYGNTKTVALAPPIANYYSTSPGRNWTETYDDNYYSISSSGSNDIFYAMRQASSNSITIGGIGVGIKNASPLRPLDVTGNTRISGTIELGTATLGNHNYSFVLRNSSDTKLYTLPLDSIYANNYDSTLFARYGTKLYPKSVSWDLGIGTTNPLEKVHIVDTANAYIRTTADGSTGVSGFKFENDDQVWATRIRGDYNDRYEIYDDRFVTIPFVINPNSPTGSLVIDSDSSVSMYDLYVEDSITAPNLDEQPASLKFLTQDVDGNFGYRDDVTTVGSLEDLTDGYGIVDFTYNGTVIASVIVDTAELKSWILSLPSSSTNYWTFVDSATDTLKNNVSQNGVTAISGNIELDSATATIGRIIQNGKTVFTTAYFNTFVGIDAGNDTTSGIHNAAVGYATMPSIYTATANSSFGYMALYGLTTGRENTGIGSGALAFNYTGDCNTAIGGNAGAGMSGDTNVAVGYFAGAYNQGDKNIFIGNRAGYYEINGSNKLYIENSDISTPLIYGDFNKDSLAVNGTLSADLDSAGTAYSVYYNKTTNLFTYDSAGTGGVSPGDGDTCLFRIDDDTVINKDSYKVKFTDSVYVMRDAIPFLTEGDPLAGFLTLRKLPGTDVRQLAMAEFQSDSIGKVDSSMYSDTSNYAWDSDKLDGQHGSYYLNWTRDTVNGEVYPTTIGDQVGIGTANPAEMLDVVGNINIPTTTSTVGIIKQNANPLLHTYQDGGGDNLFLGNQVGNFTMTGNNNYAIGTNVMEDITTAYENIAIGTYALEDATVCEGNVAIGCYSLRSAQGSGRNVAIGNGAMRYANSAVGSTNSSNTAVGYNTLAGTSNPANNTGYSNSAFGGATMNLMTSGYENTALGSLAMYNSTIANGNVAVGYDAMRSNLEGIQNVAMGHGALWFNRDNDASTAIGYQAMYYADSRTTSERITYNTALGYQALRGFDHRRK